MDRISKRYSLVALAFGALLSTSGWAEQNNVVNRDPSVEHSLRISSKLSTRGFSPSTAQVEALMKSVRRVTEALKCRATFDTHFVPAANPSERGSLYLRSKGTCPHPFQVTLVTHGSEKEFSHAVFVDNKPVDVSTLSFKFQGHSIPLGSAAHWENRDLIASEGLLEMQRTIQETTLAKDDAERRAGNLADWYHRESVQAAEYYDLLVRHRIITPPPPRPPDRCFPAGTPIQTPSGVLPIERLREGDEVFSYDFIEKRAVVSRIQKTQVRKANQLLEIYLQNGSLIQVTEEHPFYVKSRNSYVAAGKLAKGDTLFARINGGALGEVAVVSVSSRQLAVPVFNFQVERYGNYFAGGVLVHNKTIGGGEEETHR